MTQGPPVRELQAFSGMLNFYRRFLRGVARTLFHAFCGGPRDQKKCSGQLLGRNVEVNWSEEMQRSTGQKKCKGQLVRRNAEVNWPEEMQRSTGKKKCRGQLVRRNTKVN